MDIRDNTEPTLPPPPEPPDPRECCQSGCNPCVLDLYQEELALWRQRCASLKARGGGTRHSGEAG